MKHSDALTICELAVDRQVICLELKQFPSQFKNVLPNLFLAILVTKIVQIIKLNHLIIPRVKMK